MKIILLFLGIVCVFSSISTSYVFAQYSAYSGIPFPNCVETVDDRTVILHWVGSCANNPFFENLRYYADLGYHVQNTTGTAAESGHSETTLVNLGYTSTYDAVLKELLTKEGVCPAPPVC